MTNNIYELKKLSGLSVLKEHSDYSDYVGDLRSVGYRVEVDDSKDTLVFTVSKGFGKIVVTEPESGVYNCDGETFASLKRAVTNCLDPQLYETEDLTNDDWTKDSKAVKKSTDIAFVEKMIDKWGERGNAWLNHPVFAKDSEEVTEWANSPNNQIDDRETVRDQPEGSIVDMSLRRLIGANAAPVQIEENTYSFDTMLEKIRSISSNGVIAEADAACDDEEADEAHDDGDEEDVVLKEGFKDKLKILALLGLTGMAAHTAADALSAKSTPLGIALQQAADQGDSEASHHLKNLGAYIDSDTSTLRDLNRKYLKEGTITSQDVMESYRSYKSEENKMVGNDDGALDESPSMSDESSDDEGTNWDQMMMDIDMDTTEEHGEYVPLGT